MPGPQEHLFICEDESLKLLGLHIVFPNLIPQVIILSYAGDVFSNINVDPDLIAGAELLLPRLFLEELQDIAAGLGIDSSQELMLSSSPHLFTNGSLQDMQK